MSERSVSSSVQQPANVEARGAGGKETEGGGGLLGSLWNPIQTMAKRTAIYVAFLAAKQPSRIRQVLRQVRS